MDRRLLLIRYGEITLKGHNKAYFLDTLQGNIKYALSGITGAKVKRIQGRLTVENIAPEDEYEVISRVKRVFGVVGLVRAIETEPELSAVKNAALSIMKDKENVTFKVEARRGDKSFPLTSPELAREVGAHVLINTDTITVDVHHPDYILQVEIRERAYVYCETIPALAGLPMGTGGSGALLLSGGIDSPVAGFKMASRGMKLTAVHFHSFPYTGLGAKQKAIDLAEKLSPYNMGIELYCVSLTHIQEEIIEKCDGSYLTIILRRFMLRVAERICEREGLSALITGESLGQVASQTIESINATNAVVSIPILRPLIGSDKNEITDIAKKIDTFEISIRPYEDCCTVFVPKHPQTKPKLSRVLEEEAKLDCEALVLEAMESIEIISLGK